MCDTVAPAIPDYNWTHATDGYVDKDGFAIVIVQVPALITALALLDDAKTAFHFRNVVWTYENVELTRKPENIR
jgi:hypothetical protein